MLLKIGVAILKKVSCIANVFTQKVENLKFVLKYVI